MPDVDPLLGGRQAFQSKRWAEAVRLLSAAERRSPLAPEDYEALTVARFLIGPDQSGAVTMGEASAVLLERGDAARAARAAFWAAATLRRLGEFAAGAGWQARAERILDEAGLDDSVERGYLPIGAVFAALRAGDLDAASRLIDTVTAIARRFDDNELLALIRQAEGRALLLGGELHRGMAILDEVMLSATTADMSPLVVGMLFCILIRTAHDMHDLGRAREWTAAIEQWCLDQPDLDMYRGECMVYRAHVLQVSGDWPRATEQVTLACLAFMRPPSHPATGFAFYEQGELHRLCGRYADAAESFSNAASHGHPAQPGLALLRLAQGRTDAAIASILRVLKERLDPLGRAAILPAAVEILLAGRDLAGAERSHEELRELAQQLDSDFLRGWVGQLRGAVLLAAGRPDEALPELRRATTLWHQLHAAHHAARTRLLIGLACRELGDEDAALLEIEGAQRTFRRLGAEPDVRHAAGLLATPGHDHAFGLTDREVELLGLLATGKTNREIATDLFISEKTVARHVSNIFNKLGVSSRAAATAYALKHGLA